MLNANRVAWALSVVAVLGAGTACGMDFPSGPVRIVTGSAGGPGDIVARLIAQKLMKPLGQTVLVENRPGAGGIIAAAAVHKAPPDGHSMVFTASSLWLAPMMQPVPFDPMKDFSPVTLVVRIPNIIVVHPSLPVKSIKELIDFARARPGELNYASGITGSPAHLAAELFKSKAGINIVSVPYKGVGPAVAAVASGQVPLSFPPLSAAMGHVKSGRLKALAIASAKPSALAPDMATVAASGLPGYESSAQLGMVVRAETPAAIVKRLNHEIVLILNQSEVRQRLQSIGAEPIGSSPEEYAAAITAETTELGKLIQDLGLTKK